MAQDSDLRVFCLRKSVEIQPALAHHLWLLFLIATSSRCSGEDLLDLRCHILQASLRVCARFYLQRRKPRIRL